MIGRILVLIVALQFALTGAFAHGTVASDHCVRPAAGHIHLATSPEHSQDSVGLSGRQDLQAPMSLLNCNNLSCADHCAWYRSSAASVDVRSDRPKLIELGMTPQSVIIANLRRPLQRDSRARASARSDTHRDPFFAAHLIRLHSYSVTAGSRRLSQ
ncbi:hypothetical protein U879_00090 [Defluviimonas sp. 20V17]|uniref:Uncharacterized protein n=1 Tax=Allgaiera indica TaxID=765699 RepID=A0AAN4UNN3_9RHOB|nr:hypothetical protein [Allgaiera indica]KDB05732.1 hypothetical protein U879_00090 [Defluviimonas sp. 20V17]GHD98512.1 hypothetical protein GCM10008024_02320 [Allgaiera indica]